MFFIVPLPFLVWVMKRSGSGEPGTNAAQQLCKAMACFCNPVCAPRNPLAPVSAACSSASLTKANPDDFLCRTASKRLSLMILQDMAVGQCREASMHGESGI